MSQIFISYSRKDVNFARRIAENIADRGIEVWIDLEDIHAGSKWSESIQAGLDSSQAMVIIISPTSMDSNNVRDEWQYFLDQDKPVIPILYKPAKIHFQLNRIQYIDFHKQSFEQGLTQLAEQLRLQGISVTGQFPVSPSTKGLERRDKLVRYWVGGIIILIFLILGGRSFIQNNADNETIEDTLTPTSIPNSVLATLDNTRELCEQPESAVSIRIHMPFIDSDFANIRSGPGSTYDIVVNALEGDVFTACYSLRGFNDQQEQINWYQIAHPSGQLLYISSEIVDLVDPDVSFDQLPQATVTRNPNVLTNEVDMTASVTNTPRLPPPTPQNSGGGE